MTNSVAAQLIALGVLALISLVLVVVRRSIAVAKVRVSYASADGVSHTVQAGQIIPRADLALIPAGSYTTKTLPLLRALVVGADNRTSTSKTVVFAWTYAVAFGLISLVVAKWLGSRAGYDNLVKNGLREEYWLFLGGTYASAILAKYSATAQAAGSAKTSAGVGTANPAQLITDDRGGTDIGDFQYVLFNGIALAFYLGEFVPHLGDGIPHLPSVLTGIALTSAGGYSAKKLFLQQATPTLTSVLPSTVTLPQAEPPAATVEVWGSNLIIPGDVAPGGSALPPTVMIGGQNAKVVASEQTLGSDHLTVEVPHIATTDDVLAKVTAVRGDGLAALGPGGSDGVALTVKPPA